MAVYILRGCDLTEIMVPRRARRARSDLVLESLTSWVRLRPRNPDSLEDTLGRWPVRNGIHQERFSAAIFVVHP